MTLALNLGLAIIAIILLWGGGYLYGTKKGQKNEAALRSALTAQVTAAQERASRAEAAAAKVQSERADVDQEGRIHQIVQQAVAPVMGLLDSPLSGLKIGTGRADLAGFLDAMVEKGGFEAAILSDSRGLLLAASSNAARAEVRAGVTALLVTVAQQIVRAGETPPVAFLVHDERSRLSISRLFTVDGQRFLLTAVSSGAHLSPTILDPALEHVEQLMHDWTSPYREMAASGRPSRNA